MCFEDRCLGSIDFLHSLKGNIEYIILPEIVLLKARKMFLLTQCMYL